MTTRERIDEVIDQLDEVELRALLNYAEWLAADKDEEELTPEEWQRVRQGEAAIARGEFAYWDEVKDELVRERLS